MIFPLLQQLLIKEFYMKIIPRRLYGFRVRPTTKVCNFVQLVVFLVWLWSKAICFEFTLSLEELATANTWPLDGQVKASEANFLI